MLKIRNKFFLMCIIVRVMSVFVVQTWYVPDEYWQSLEVAHNLAFGYGYLTWEWVYGIRSYLYPGIISCLFKLIAFLRWDSVSVLVYLPRILQAVMSAYTDMVFWRWFRDHKLTSRTWAVAHTTTCWFWGYCATRTLTNTLETSLTVFALSAYPWYHRPRKQSSTKYLYFVGLACIVRPTAFITWFPLCLYHILKSNYRTKVLVEFICVGGLMAVLTILVDSFYAGHILFTPWNFFKMNVIHGVGRNYGVNPFHWYFTSGIPVVIGLPVIPFLVGAYRIVKRPGGLSRWSLDKLLLVVICWSLLVYSLMSHKEFRFILPLMPMFMFIASDTVAKWSYTQSRWMMTSYFVMLLLTGVLPSLYFSLVHQRGVLDVMPVLAKEANLKPDANFMFLMPCHSTPLYSHLHVNVSSRFLTCEPNFHDTPNYMDEAELFYSSPASWLRAEYGLKRNVVPTHLVMYDCLQQDIESFLKENDYRLMTRIFNTQFVLSSKASTYILVYAINCLSCATTI